VGGLVERATPQAPTGAGAGTSGSATSQATTGAGADTSGLATPQAPTRGVAVPLGSRAPLATPAPSRRSQDTIAIHATPSRT
jgi:hypothetical protein